jgi:hypothetical protein
VAPLKSWMISSRHVDSVFALNNRFLSPSNRFNGGNMKYFLQILIFVLFIQLTGASATSYMKFWVNGDTAHTVNQGDVFA